MSDPATGDILTQAPLVGGEAENLPTDTTGSLGTGPSLDDASGWSGIVDLSNWRERRAARAASPAELSFELLDSLLNDGLEGAERSNRFDEWVDSLSEMAETLRSTSEFRQLLGLLLSVTENQDVIDFTMEQLQAFHEAAFELKRPTVSHLDAQRAMRKITDVGLRASLPLHVAAEDTEQIAELEQMMATISNGRSQTD
jgi:hypothetical protein